MIRRFVSLAGLGILGFPDVYRLVSVHRDRDRLAFFAQPDQNESVLSPASSRAWGKVMAGTTLKIRELRVRAVKVPMAHPHKTASGTITESPLVLTDVLTEEGVVGHSYVFCYAALALKPVALLVK